MSHPHIAQRTTTLGGGPVIHCGNNQPTIGFGIEWQARLRKADLLTSKQNTAQFFSIEAIPFEFLGILL